MHLIPFRNKEYAIISICIGIGILLGVFLPPIGWMLGCALALIACGVYLLRYFC